MNISFIITTYNIEPYIRQCLESLRPCVQPGDQVILVDDGSTDRTVEVIEAFIAEGGFGQSVRWTPVLLGTNTIGGVGIPGNIGLDHAEGDAIFFVDGDDYLIAEGFRQARRAFEAKPTDIRIADYLELDQKAGKTKPPADAGRWAGLDRPMSDAEARLAALSLIAVPWRKFYRTEFLRRHRIRYPEGDFFFEDNPFHWQVCTRAESIAFSHEIICHHRINRPGQTMASNGMELAAFFTHFRTILADLPEGATDLRRQAIRWVLGNMSWHIGRLDTGVMLPYGVAAQRALELVSDADWAALSPDMSHTWTWHHAARLRAGDVWSVVRAWREDAAREAQMRSLRKIETALHDIKLQTNGLGEMAKMLQQVRQATKGLGGVDTMLKDLAQQTKVSREILQAKQAVEEFEAVLRLFEAAEEPALAKDGTRPRGKAGRG